MFQESNDDPHFTMYPGTNDLQCTVCQKVIKPSHAKWHWNLHIGHYKYHCPQCGKGFMSKTSLRGHMVDHTGVQEFQCEICLRKFNYKYSLKRHKALAHETCS